MFLSLKVKLSVTEEAMLKVLMNDNIVDLALVRPEIYTLLFPPSLFYTVHRLTRCGCRLGGLFVYVLVSSISNLSNPGHDPGLLSQSSGVWLRQ